MNKTEIQKQRLVAHLIEEVANGLSGRDGEEIVDAWPSRVIFAGVLQPVRGLDAWSLTESMASGVPPADTALGLDFRVAVPTGSTVKLKITPRWSLYYPVYPSFGQALFANPGLRHAETEAGSGQSAAAANESLPSSPSESRPESLSDDDDRTLAGEDQEASQVDEVPKGRVVLPRVFRRYNVRPEPLFVELPAEAQEAKTVGAHEIDSAQRNARSHIEADPRLWRHLAEPAAAARDLGDAGNLKNEDAYVEALSKAGHSPVALPPWKVTLQVDISHDLAAANTMRLRVLLSNTTDSDSPEGTDRLLEERAIFDAQLTVD